MAIYKKINIWYLSSFIISIIVAIPIVTIFSSFFAHYGVRFCHPVFRNAVFELRQKRHSYIQDWPKWPPQ